MTERRTWLILWHHVPTQVDGHKSKFTFRVRLSHRSTGCERCFLFIVVKGDVKVVGDGLLEALLTPQVMFWIERSVPFIIRTMSSIP